MIGYHQNLISDHNFWINHLPFYFAIIIIDDFLQKKVPHYNFFKDFEFKSIIENESYL